MEVLTFLATWMAHAVATHDAAHADGADDEARRGLRRTAARVTDVAYRVTEMWDAAAGRGDAGQRASGEGGRQAPPRGLRGGRACRRAHPRAASRHASRLRGLHCHACGATWCISQASTIGARKAHARDAHGGVPSSLPKGRRCIGNVRHSSRAAYRLVFELDDAREEDEGEEEDEQVPMEPDACAPTSADASAADGVHDSVCDA